MFALTANNLTFKGLRRFALTSTAAQLKVKTYFENIKSGIKNAPCPVLKKADLLSQLNDQGSLPRGSPSYIPESRILAVLKNSQIFEVNGLKWQYQPTGKESLKEITSEMPDEVIGTAEITEGKKGLFGIIDDTLSYGHMVFKTCSYKIGTTAPLKFHLWHEEFILH